MAKPTTLVFTIAIGIDYARLTVPTIRAYAERIGADFILVEKCSLGMGPIFEKFRMYEYLPRYNRVTVIDADALVSNDCPNLFDVVEPDKIGMVNEITSARTWGKDLLPETTFSALSVERMAAVAAFYDVEAPDWKWSRDHHYNTGVIVASKCHQDLFAPPEREFPECPWDQSVINLRIGTCAKARVPCASAQEIAVQELPYRYNHTRWPVIRTPVPRRQSYILHYNSAPKTVAAIAADIEAWKKMGKL